MSRPLSPTDPARLGSYVLRGRLGVGGQGTVYLGEAPDGTPVAVKLLRAELADDPAARRRFQREVAAARRVARFCTAQVLDVDVSAVQPYVVSEYVDGPSLQQAVQAAGPFAGGDLERLVVNTATALVAIHEADVVHRDFKPANVLMGPDGPRVVDFGIARPLDTTATLTSGLVGSPWYMAPEQFADTDPGGPPGPPADVWAWSATMVFAATGRPPFGGGDPAAVMHRVLTAPPDLGRPGQIPSSLAGLLRRCLSKDPEARPTAAGVLEALLGRTTPRVASPAPPAPRRRMSWPLGAAVAALVVAGAVVAGALILPGAFDRDPGTSPDPDTTARSTGPTPPPVHVTGRGRLEGTRTQVLRKLDGPITLTAYAVRPETAPAFGSALYLWDFDAGEFVQQQGLVNASVASPNGRWVAELAQLRASASLRIVDRVSGTPRTFDLPSGAYHTPVWSSDSLHLLLTALGPTLTGGTKGFVVVRADVGEVGELVRSEGTTFFWGPKARTVVTNLPDKQTVVFRDLDGDEVRRLNGLGELGGAGLGPVSPDDRSLVTYCSPTEACVWDAATGEGRGSYVLGRQAHNPVLGWYDESALLASVQRHGDTRSVARVPLDSERRPVYLTKGPDDAALLFRPRAA